MHSNSLYHSLLRIATAVVAVMLVFEGGLLSPVTAKLADQTELYLANAVGVSVGVAPTERRVTESLMNESSHFLSVRLKSDLMKGEVLPDLIQERLS
jgi:hypothetical protein